MLRGHGKGDAAHISFVSHSSVQFPLFKDLAAPVQRADFQQSLDEERVVTLICSLGKTKFPGFGCIFHSSCFKSGKAKDAKKGGEK